MKTREIENMKAKHPDLIKASDSFVWNTTVKQGDHLFVAPVFRREEKHSAGEMNNTDSEYWMLHDKRAALLASIEADPENKSGRYRPSNQDIEKWLSGEDRYQWIPFMSKYAHTTTWSYTFEEYNSVEHRTKWGDDSWSVNKRVFCRMYCNGREVYHFGTMDMDYAITKARYLVAEFNENTAIRMSDPDDIIGKKVWFHDQPGVITRHFLPDDRIVIKSERTDGKGFDLTRKRDVESDWPESEWNGQMEVHTGIFDKDIYWYRN